MRSQDKRATLMQTAKTMSTYLPKILAILGLSLVLSACASLSKSACETGDWEQIGEDDGDRGQDPEIFERHVEACASHDIQPDKQAWEIGYSGGLSDYCSRQGGFEAGKRGTPYRDVCTEGFEEDFRVGYRIGKGLYEVQTDIDEQRRKLQQLEHQLQINAGYSKDPAVREERRRYLLTRIIRLRQRIDLDINEYRRLEQRAEKLLSEQ